MKKLIKTFLFTLMCVLAISITAAATNDAKVLVNGKYIEMDQKPIFKDDRILIPVRAVGEALKCKVEWNHDTQTVTLNSGATELKITIGETEMKKINVSRNPIDITIKMEVPAFIENGRTIKKVEKESLFRALDIGAFWLESAKAQ